MLTALAGAVLPVAASTGTVKTESKVDTTQVHELQAVEVFSTRAHGRTPMAYDNVSQQQIRKMNFGQDLPRLLLLTPSVTMTSDAGNGIGYTTLRVRGTDPSRINITVNGIPQSDAESSELFWVNIGDFASSLGSLQIQRGVGTSTNGSAAFGATVNMQTEGISAEPYLTLDASAGSYYSHKETMRFSTGLIKDHWGFQGRLSNIGSKGYLDRAWTKLNNYFLQGGYFSDNTMVKLVTFSGEEHTYHAWNYTSKYEQSLYGRRYNSCGEYYDENGNPLYYKNQTDNYNQQNYQLILTQRFGRFFNLHAALHYTKGKGYYEEYKTDRDLSEYGLTPVSVSAASSDLVRQKKMDNDFYGAIADLNYTNHNGLTAVVGGGWNRYDGDHFGLVTWVKENVANLTPDWEYYRNNAVKNDANIYGKVNWEFLRGLSAYVDLQYRHVSYRLQNPTDAWGYNEDGRYIYRDDFDFFNPKFGLNYQIARNHRVYASYAISHREPVRNNYEDYAANGYSYPKAERLNDFELGYEFTGEKFSASVNGYWMDYHNQFVLTGELDDIGEAVTRNLEKSYRLGVELQAAWMPVDWFRWDANATFSKNRVQDLAVTLDDYTTKVQIGDQPLSFSPDVIFNTWMTFKYKGFSAVVTERFVGEQYLTNTGFKTMECQDADGNTTYETLMLGSHWTTDLDLSYSFSLRKLGVKEVAVGLSIYNLFSAKYDNNGWAAPQFEQRDGKVVAVNTWGIRDYGAVGFAPSAPFNCMAHLTLSF